MKLIQWNKSFIGKTDEDEPRELNHQVEYGCEKVEDIDSDASKIKINFTNFGPSHHDFTVQMNWLDVQSMVREFIEMGHPYALYLERVIRLADKIESAGWRPEEPPSKEFDDIVPSQSN